MKYALLFSVTFAITVAIHTPPAHSCPAHLQSGYNPEELALSAQYINHRFFNISNLIQS